MEFACPHCQSSLPPCDPGVKAIICPSCGSSIRLDANATTGWLPEEAPKRLGKFEFLEQLGTGSFGTVYKARDTELDRTVAIKIPRAGSLPRPQDMERFLREAKSAAQLKHPSIVALHDAGTIDGTCCLVSEFIPGATLAERLTAKRPSFRQAPELMAQVADALHYAHQHGVVHRDIKPSNIMLDLEGRPHLMDFGLAKRAADESTMTLEGQVLGTPAYMPPEQARGEVRKVDARSDIYSLGVILYELLTGELPFRGQTRMLLVQVMQDEPRPPRRLNDSIRRDLETICLKAMAKEASRRYQTAQEFADDLRRWLKGEPIQARPVSAWERGINWVKRRPALAGLLIVSGVAVVALGVVVTGFVYNRQLQGALQETEQAKEKAEAATQEAERYKYFHHIARAHTGWREGNLVRVEPLLDECPADRRGWGWHYLKRLCHADLLTLRGHSNWVWSVAFSPDGQRLASASYDGTVKVWDAATGQEVLAALTGHKSEVRCVAFSPDGKRLASASYDQTVKIWDAATGQETHTLKGHSGPVGSVAFSPDGKRLASAGGGDEVKVWDAATGQEALTIKGHTGGLSSVAFSPEGKRLASAGLDGTVKVWDAGTGHETLTLRGHTGSVTSVAFSPEGKRLASAGLDGTVKVWDAGTGQELRTLRGHTQPAWSVAFSPEGKRLASASPDGTVKIWSATTAPEGSTFDLGSAAYSVAFDSEGTRLASATATGAVKLWDTMTGQEACILPRQSEGERSVSLSPDGTRFASAGANGAVTIRDVTTGQVALTLPGSSGHVAAAAFSGDGKRFVSVSAEGNVMVWDVTTGRVVLPLPSHAYGLVPGICVALDSEGSRLALAGSNPDGRKGTVKVWDTTTGQVALTLTDHPRPVRSVAFSPDRSRLASGSEDGTVKVWNTTTGRPVHVLRVPPFLWAGALTFSPDGTRLAAIVQGGRVQLWDVETGQEVLMLQVSPSDVTSLAFSPDGTRLASARADGTIQIWDARPWGPEAAVEREALGLLDFLFAKPLRKADVIHYLHNSLTISRPARDQALALVDRYREETNPETYHQESWAVGRQPYLNAFQYRFALQQAEAAYQLAPDEAKYRTALGAAQYRAGRYEEASESLKKADPANKDSPANLAFLAMAQHRIGKNEEAKGTLARLRDLMKQERWAKDAEARGFLHEAEKLIEGKTAGSEGKE